MSANPTSTIANMQNLMIQLGAAVPNTVIAGSSVGGLTFGPVQAQRAPRKLARRR